MKLHASTKIGLAAGILMLSLSGILFYLKGDFESGLRYVNYVIFVGAIVLAQQLHYRTKASALFGNYFGEGFKCFIVATLLMVIFTWLIIKFNPALISNSADMLRKQLTDRGNRTPGEINNAISMYKNYYPTMTTSMVILVYLTIGCLTSVAGAFFFSKKRELQSIGR